jgi:hypothetical protein
MGGELQWLIICSEACKGSLLGFLYGSFQSQPDFERIATFWDILRQVLKGWKRCRNNHTVLIHRDIKLSNSKPHSSSSS